MNKATNEQNGLTGEPEKLAYGESDAARMLDISPRHLFSERKRGRIGYLQVGSRILYPRAELEAYIERRTIPASISQVAQTDVGNE